MNIVNGNNYIETIASVRLCETSLVILGIIYIRYVFARYMIWSSHQPYVRGLF
jgi:TRAP-type C4-dicarboxylate transport system permease small subunit